MLMYDYKIKITIHKSLVNIHSQFLTHKIMIINSIGYYKSKIYL